MTATTPELDVPYTDQPEDDTITDDNQYNTYNVITDAKPSITDNNRLGYLLQHAATNNNNNNNNNDDNDFDNNKGYIEKILNKDKEKLNEKGGNNLFTFVNNNGLRSSKNSIRFNANDDSNIDKNVQTYNNIDDTLMSRNKKHKRRKRDGKSCGNALLEMVLFSLRGGQGVSLLTGCYNFLFQPG